jgi:hypothetical protein
MLRAILMGAVVVGSMHAQMCTGRTMSGPYGLQLSGKVTISGNEAPAAVLATLSFASDGSLSGVSSVNFNGLLLGNPITGKYELNPDCTLLLDLQDDSGAYQHFRGTVAGESDRISLRQTDKGTGERGVLRKAAETCTASDFRTTYSFTLSGAATPLATAGMTQPVSIAGMIRFDLAGKLFVTQPVETPATFELQSGCIVQFTFPPLIATGGPVHLRGILVNGGAEILAIQTDPGMPVAVVFVGR